MSWLLTRSGRKFDLANPTPDMVDITDIAHSLSMQCRFAGHTRSFYSVAQHCCLVADLAPPSQQLVGLLHDATEAYVGDLVRPLKQGMRHFANSGGSECLYDLTERKVWLAICLRFGIDPVLPTSVKHADMVALATEKRDLMPLHPEPWPCLIGISPARETIKPWSTNEAASAYLTRFAALIKQQGSAAA